MFFGVSGFILALSVSKFIQSGLVYSFEPTEENKLMIKFNPPLERVFQLILRVYTILACSWSVGHYNGFIRNIEKSNLICEHLKDKYRDKCFNRCIFTIRQHTKQKTKLLVFLWRL